VPDLGPEAVAQPLTVFLPRLGGGNPQNETLFEARRRHILSPQRVCSFDSCAASAADQAAKPAIAVPVHCDRYEFQSTLEAELRPDEQFQLQQLRRHVGPYNSGNGTLISDGERAIPQDAGAFDEFLRVRSAAQESKVADAMQLHVRRRQRAGCGPGHPNTPCRYQR
jgi:hypothetical protein